MALLELENVTRRFGGVVALDVVSLDARVLYFPTEEAAATAADELAAKDWRVGLGRRDAE